MPSLADWGEDEFRLIRLPKGVCDRHGHVGNVTTTDGTLVFHDNATLKNYKVISNHEKAKVFHDLLKVSQTEAVHLGKVSEETLICVPDDDLQ